MTARRDLSTLPKANLHLHVTGSMRTDTLADLVDRYGLTVPAPLPADRSNPWPAFQGRYDAARAAIRTTDDLRRVLREAVEDNLAEGCRWIEIQLDPTPYAELLGGVEQVVEAALDAVAAAPCALIVASSWARSGPHAAGLAELAATYAGRGVVGFGLSNDERRGRVEDFVDACRIAAHAGLTIVPHAGFYEGGWHVRACVERLGARRIGHGVTAMTDQATVSMLARLGVMLEVCPTSYPPFGVAEPADLPLRSLLAAGVPITLGSDDPLLFGADVTDQYRIARDGCGLTDDELAAIAGQSLAASSAPAALQREACEAIVSWLAG